MQRDKKQAPFVNIGSSLLLVVFLVLCLVTFATLSLSSAQSDYSFSSRAAQRRTDYYQACNVAEDVLAQIDAILEKSADSPAGGSDGSRSWMNGLDFTQINGTEFDEVGLEIVYDPEAAALSYQIPVNEKQALEVGLVLTPDRDEGYYEIKKWQLVNTRPREGSQPLQLMPMPE